jgi:hypothetical protein
MSNPRKGNNPFEEEDDVDPKPKTVKPLISSGKPPPAPGRASTNPFEFDSGFQTVPKEETPILFGMDADDELERSLHGHMPPPPPEDLTPALPASAKTSNKTFGVKDAMGWLGVKKKDATDHVPLEEDDEEVTISPRRKKKTVTEWPYDYYHMEQQRYYDTIDKSPQKRNISTPSQQQQDSYVSRPDDLVDIPTAVQGLSLVDFEACAQQRAIGIVSTWIYDEGLMDELIIGASVKTNVSDDVSVKTSEGVEVAAKGYAVGVDNKIDKEIEKLRATTSRELALINARLNDGVAASGSEVQELVNAVSATKTDLGKLRELSTYIAQGNDNNALLQDYPRLKAAIHARRNLARCFRELDFFTQIPATCERLRDEMHSSEWSEEEWTVLRDVCREHVELEVFLVEAEAGMKARIDEERTSDSTRGGKKSSTTKSGTKNYASVDRFLEEHVRTVWELGDEIKLRVLSGVGMTFDLALNNPAGMVALVEAVELYEAAGQEYHAVYGNRNSADERLHFTDMRRGALEHIAKDFEVRGLEVFQEVQQMAADSAEEDMATANFNAVLRASNDLTNQMDFVTHQMAPCFPKYWALEALWTSVVADVCSQQILGQIGGRDAHRLPDLTVTQLLDLVAWIESFREKIEDAFPDIVVGKVTNGPKPSIESGASLLHGEGKEIDVVRAKESVEWVSGVLWEVHRLAQDEFLVRTRAQAEEWLENVYSADHAKTQNADGLLTTSLCEDVYSLVGVQLRTIRERLTKRSEVLVLAVSVIFSYLRMKQLECRDDFLTDLECCCAAANDFIRMSDQCEEILADLESAATLSKESHDTLAAQSNELLTLYSSDAVYAAQRVHVYIFEPIEEEIGGALFNVEWEESLTHNELALTLVRTLEDYMGDLELWLEELMVRKVVDSLIIATINFYVKCLLKKADNKNAKESTFKDTKVAITRILGDISVIREYFESLIEVFPALGRVIGSEFEVLDTMVELMMIAAGQSNANMEEQVFVLQRKIKDVNLTRLVVGDLWHLVNTGEERSIYEQLDEHETTLKAMAPEGQDPVDSRNTDTGLRFDQVILTTIGKSSRKRPIGTLGGNIMNKFGLKAGQGDQPQQQE